MKIKAVVKTKNSWVNVDFSEIEDCGVPQGDGSMIPVSSRVPPEIVDTPREDTNCFGMRDEDKQMPPRDPDETDEEYEKKASEADFVNRFFDGGCRFFMKDTPRIETYPNVPFFIEYHFKGEIRDTCRGDALEDRRIFNYWLGGFITPAGQYMALPPTGTGPGVPAPSPTVWEVDPEGNKTGTVSPTGGRTTMPPIPPRRP